MSNHLINIHDERLARLYDETLNYELSVDDDNLMWVQSSSRPRLMHRVELVGDSIKCSCETTEGLACRHRATAAAHWFPVTCWQKWFEDESAKHLELLYRICTNGKLTRSEKRKLSKAIRQVEQSIPQESVDDSWYPKSEVAA